jgi:hypothetical protein
MKFERGKEITEVLKIGRRANAYKVSHFDIHGKLLLPLDKTKLTEEIIEKYKFTPKTAAIEVGTSFLLSGEAFEHALGILIKDGISKNFDEYIKSLILTRAPSKMEKYPDMPFDPTKIIKTRIKWVLIKINTGKKFLETIQLTFKMTDKDFLYKDELYRIAKPKDGGLDD